MNHPTQPPGQARYLNGKLVSVIATDYGGYPVTLVSSQPTSCGHLPGRSAPAAPAMPRLPPRVRDEAERES